MSKILILIVLFISLTLEAYESEERLEAVIIGKVAKYISWKEHHRDFFVITVLNNQSLEIFKSIYKDKKIKSRPVKIKNIDNINDINSTDILYIPQINSIELDKILKKVKNKNILTISNIRGFAQKGGGLQLYFVKRKLKLKLNIDVMREEEFDVELPLLRIVEIQKRED